MEVVKNASEIRDASAALSGAGMDRRIERDRFSPKRLVAIAATVVAAILAVWLLFGDSTGRTLVIGEDKIVISKVTTG